MLSIDIGSKKVCVVQGNYRSGSVAVDTCAEIEYQSEVVSNGVITDRPALSLTINELIKTNRMKSTNTVVTINSSDIVSREFTLPFVKLPTLKSLVNNEMKRILGDDNGYVIDFVINQTTEENMYNVTAFAIKKDIVENHYSLLKELKLKPFAFDIHANSMSKLLSKKQINGQAFGDDNIIVADIGYSKISFYGFSKGICHFNRTEVSLVQEFVRELSGIYRTEVMQEQMSRLDFSPDYQFEDTVVSDTCKYFLYRLSEEIQKYIQYIILNSDIKSVSRVFICGGIASVNGIGQALTELVKTAVEPLQTVEGLNLPQGCSPTKACNAAGALIRL